MNDMQQQTLRKNSALNACLSRQTRLTSASSQALVPGVIKARAEPAAVLVPRSAFSAATGFAGTLLQGALGTHTR